MKYDLSTLHESIHDLVNINAGYKNVSGQGAYNKLQQMKQSGQKVSGIGATEAINKAKNTLANKASGKFSTPQAKFLANTGLQSKSA